MACVWCRLSAVIWQVNQSFITAPWMFYQVLSWQSAECVGRNMLAEIYDVLKKNRLSRSCFREWEISVTKVSLKTDGISFFVQSVMKSNPHESFPSILNSKIDKHSWLDSAKSLSSCLSSSISNKAFRSNLHYAETLNRAIASIHFEIIFCSAKSHLMVQTQSIVHFNKHLPNKIGKKIENRNLFENSRKN